eukprot:1929926-Prymnesium_polylepis.1
MTPARGGGWRRHTGWAGQPGRRLRSRFCLITGAELEAQKLLHFRVELSQLFGLKGPPKICSRTRAAAVLSRMRVAAARSSGVCVCVAGWKMRSEVTANGVAGPINDDAIASCWCLAGARFAVLEQQAVGACSEVGVAHGGFAIVLAGQRRLLC